MTEKIPGAMFFLGCSLEDGMGRDLHTSIFDIDERCLPIGTAIMVAAVNRYLNKKSI
jgi:metal-dependent amidase/aminoacylase/carboxypeptidase family protein